MPVNLRWYGGGSPISDIVDALGGWPHRLTSPEISRPVVATGPWPVVQKFWPKSR